MKINVAVFWTLGLVLCAFTSWDAVKWDVKDDSYTVKFDTKGASGIIKGLKGTIQFDQNNAAQSMFDVSVAVNTLTTGNGMKNHHAKGEGFLDVEKYPGIHFVSTHFEKTSNGYLVTGNLTIKDITKNVSIPFAFDQQGNEGTFRGSFQINRTDFNLIRKGVGEEIQMDLVIPVKK